MDITNNILSLADKTPASILTAVASRVKQRRLERDWTQKMLSTRAGLPLATYRRFELKGEISLHNLVLIAIALESDEDFETLFTTHYYRNLDELIAQNR